MTLIEVRELSKTYADDGVSTPALRGVSFDIGRGEFVAIMGPSGSGKSTLLHLLGFLDRPTGGTYRFDGRGIDEYTDHELAEVRNRKMGFVFQTFNLLPRTDVLENVKLPLLYSGIPEKRWNRMAEEAIEAVGLSHRLSHESSQLSGGERQRVAIARALVLRPEIIFADEPTGNLDSKSGKAVMAILEDLNRTRGHTIVLITHETYTAEQAERIIHLMDGEIANDEKVKARRTSDHFIK
ncbi:MAG: ABC transporter ATP-binding protein [Candidatus Brennerbacteria bacterium]|nr:ABC transporter ATP-binding protein [Candidatus Brennerbacteria bacterium]